jgi:MFS family permease
MRLPDSLAPLREANFCRFIAANLIDSAGSWATSVAIGFGVLARGTATDLGLVFLAREIPLIVFVLAGGVWADRWSRRSILIGTNLAGCVSQAVTASALLEGWGLGVIAAAQVVAGASQAFSRPATTGFVPELVGPDHLIRANALFGLSWSSVAFVGASVGAIMVEAVGAGWALAFDAGSYAVAALVLTTISTAGSRPHASSSPLSDLRDGWRAFRSYPWVVALVSSFGIFQLTLFPALLVLGPLVAKTRLGGAGAWATILIAEAVGSIVGGVVSLHLRPRRPLVISELGAVLVSAELLTLGLALPVGVIAAAALVGAVGLSIGGSLWFAALQANIPEHQIGRISSFDWLGSIALNPIGYLAVGPLAAATSPKTVLVCCAGAMVATVATVLVAVPSVRDVRAAPS